MYGEPELPPEGACFRDMMNQNRHSRGRVYSQKCRRQGQDRDRGVWLWVQGLSRPGWDRGLWKMDRGLCGIGGSDKHTGACV